MAHHGWVCRIRANPLSRTGSRHTRSRRYGYDTSFGRDNLITVNDTRGYTWTYEYTSASLGTGSGTHLLHKVINPENEVVEQTFYDDEKRAYLQLDGLGQVVAEINYVSTNTRVITESGRVYTDTYDSSNLLVGQTDALGQQEAYQFDDAFNRNQLEDGNGNLTHYERTPLGLTTAITDALGQVTIFSYDANNNLQTSTDARGNTTSYTYDANNNLKTVTNPLSGTTVYTYNLAGQVTAVTDENGHTTVYAYDAFGNRTVITDALGHVTRYEYDLLGRVITTTDALGKITVNEYDGADNLVKVTENYLAGQPQNYTPPGPPSGGGDGGVYNLITTYTYDGANRRETTTDTLGRVTRNEYDDAGRLIRTIQNEHPSVPDQNYQDEYNLITIYGYDEFGRQVSVTDTLNHVTRTFYDDAGRVDQTVVNFVDGSYSSSQPDEDLITKYVYDQNGNVVKTIELFGSAEARATCTVYDELNRVKKTIENCMTLLSIVTSNRPVLFSMI